MKASPKKRHSIWTKIVLLLGSNIALMAGSSLTVAMPSMMREFSSIPGATFWVSMIITLPALFVVIGGPISGFLTDKFGRKPVLVISILISGLSGSAGYIFPTITAILLTRALLGLSIAGATTATTALIADYYDGQQRAKFMGLLSGFTGLGAVVFLPIGGILVDINWHLAFLTHLPLLLLFPLAIIFTHEPEGTLQQSESDQDIRFRLDATKIYIYLAIFLGSLSFMSVPLFVAYLMTLLLGAGGLTIGLVGAAAGLFSFMGGLFYERISRRLDFRRLAISGFLLFGMGLLILGFGRSWALIIAGQLVIGFCMGLTTANLTNWLASDVKPEVRGRANGIFVTMMFLGNFIASFVYTPVVNIFNYSFTYILSAIIITLTGLGGLFLMRIDQ